MGLLIKKFLFVFIFFPLTIRGQEKLTIKITDADTKAIISNANLSISRVSYFPSDTAGNIQFDISKIKKGDTLYISCISYSTFKVVFESKDLLPKVINLNPVVYQLDEVNVANTKKRKEITVGTKAFSISEEFTHADRQYGLYINNKEKLIGVIKEIRIHMWNGTNSIDMPFKIRLFERKQNSKFPGNELMEEIIAENNKRKAWFAIDVSNLNIHIPGNGFFIIFQTLPSEYYSKIPAKKHKWIVSRVPGLAFTTFPKSYNKENYSIIGSGQNKWLIKKNIEYQMQAKVLINK